MNSKLASDLLDTAYKTYNARKEHADMCRKMARNSYGISLATFIRSNYKADVTREEYNFFVKSTRVELEIMATCAYIGDDIRIELAKDLHKITELIKRADARKFPRAFEILVFILCHLLQPIEATSPYVMDYFHSAYFADISTRMILSQALGYSILRWWGTPMNVSRHGVSEVVYLSATKSTALLDLHRLCCALNEVLKHTPLFLPGEQAIRGQQFMKEKELAMAVRNLHRRRIDTTLERALRQCLDRINADPTIEWVPEGVAQLIVTMDQVKHSDKDIP